MGYRSDVAYAFYSTDEEHDAVIKLWLDENLPFKDWDKDVWTPMKAGYIFNVSSVKWYDGYPEIDKMTEVSEQFKELFIEGVAEVGAMEFVRIGEEVEDNTMDSYGRVDYVLNIARSIEIN